MMKRSLALLVGLAAVGLFVAVDGFTEPKGPKREYAVKKTDDQWKKELSSDQFRILREKGTERAFTGAYWDHKEHGVYKCAGCGQALFSSDHKFKSGTGWPSYFQPIDAKAVVTESDTKFGMVRTEILCSRCGGHLGHVFEDGPEPTGLRYCVNSASLDFDKKK
jgi:peptide-methionine (R)-S-oxide reductase